MQGAERPLPGPPLQPAGTFVVQLRAGSDAAHRLLSGRVEHLTCGESRPFADLPDLLDFIARHMAGARETTPVTNTKEGEPS